METTTQELQRRVAQLDKLSLHLKEQFKGIDEVIDEVLNCVSSWYLFKEIQERPTIINLWGLTGVGKTSLVRAIVDFLAYEKMFFELDMGNVKSYDRHNMDLNDKLRELSFTEGINDVIFALDEFQHLRSKNESGNEQDTTREIWKLLDNGKVSVYDGNLFEIMRLSSLIKELKHVLETGITVEKGQIMKGREVYEQMTLKLKAIDENTKLRRARQRTPNMAETEDEDFYFFVKRNHYSDIMEFTGDRFLNNEELENYLLSLNGKQILKFLVELLQYARVPKVVDCSHALIFVLGNLDEAYEMSSDFSADIDADIFHKESLKIDIPHIKEALKKRFRNEQIARLGNTHILYPSLSKKAYHEIIVAELKKVAHEFYDAFGITLEFEQALHQFLYEEGVYPTQGTRPLFTTINQVIRTGLVNIHTSIFEEALAVDLVRLSYAEGYMVYAFYADKQLVHETQKIQKSSLGSLRNAKSLDEKAIVAVHEAGHAVLSVMLNNQVPELMCISTTSNRNSGFVKIEQQLNYISKKQLKNHIAVKLGGLLAEKSVFEEENITLGSASDLKQATSLAGKALKLNGMGNKIIYAVTNEAMDDQLFYDHTQEVNREIEQLMTTCQQLAIKVLEREQMLLIHLADALTRQGTMDKAMIKTIVMQYAKVNPFTLDFQEASYSHVLREKVEQVQEGSALTKFKFHQLNRSHGDGK